MLAKITPVLLLAFLTCQLHSIKASNFERDAVFHIECPDDVTVDCDAELWDLSIYGWAYVHGYGSPVPADDPVVHYHLNSCGTGHITRTWTAYDYQNNAHSCTQYIYVGGGGFSGYNIHWPPNYMTDNCGADLHPDDLPAPYNYPTYDDIDCSIIMVGFDDLVFDFGGGCKKILRTWSILDWCTYNPNYPNAGGRWDYTQVLKIKPVGGLTLDCPADVTVSAGPNCSGTYVSIPPATGIGACGSSVNVTNNSPYANSGGANASGHYPFGTTYVTFNAEDACGNWESCTMKITIKDMKKPTPICYNGLTANLMMNTDGYYIDVDAEWFNKGSFDNCTPEHLLQFRIEPSRFTCDDLGEQEVRVYVKDLDGNEQYCTTYVIIQDNMGMCPPIDTTTFNLSGTMSNLQGIPVGGMALELIEGQDEIGESSSNSSGAYKFSNVMNSGDYMIRPLGDDDYMLGLSTFDLLKLAKHINGINEFETVGELFAADANQDAEVDIQDLLTLRKLLLHHTTSLPNARAWRFIPTNLISGMEVDDQLLEVEEYWDVDGLDQHHTDIDFTVIKIGDINGSVQFGNADERSIRPEFNVVVVYRDDQFDFIADQGISLQGLQLGVEVTADDLHITPGKLPVHAGFANMVNNTALISFLDADRYYDIEKGDVLFSIGSKDDFVLENTELMHAEAYSKNEIIYDVNIQQKIDAQAEDVAFDATIYPNPLQRGESVTIICKEGTCSEISVLDSHGNVQFAITNQTQRELIIPTKNLSAGLFLVRVTSSTGDVSHMKLIVNH